MTDSDLLDSLVLQPPSTSRLPPSTKPNLHLNPNPAVDEPYGPLISSLSAVLSILPYIIAVLHSMMKHG
jgi:hypothetical protein